MKTAKVKRPLYIKRGDTYRSPVIKLGDLTYAGGPVDLTNSTVSARLVKKTGLSEPINFGIDYVDRAEKRIRLLLASSVARDIPFASGLWDLQVHDNDTDWDGTPLEGEAEIAGEITDV